MPADRPPLPADPGVAGVIPTPNEPGTTPRARPQIAALARRTDVVIACYSDERWPQLSAAVESVLGQTATPKQIVVVVDHNDRLERRVAERWPQLLVVANRFQRGASGARNTGAASVDGEILAFLDDDAVAAPTWLERLVEPFADPTVIGVGGGVDPAWEVGRPVWFPEAFFWLVGATDPTAPQVVHEVRNVWAENMAVRRRSFQAVGGFRPHFGKVGSHSSPEDTDLCIRMAAGGGRWFLVPEARVSHHVPAERSTVGFFLRRSFYEGEGKAALRALSPAGSLRVEADYATRVLPAAFLSGVRAAWTERRLAPAARSLAVAAGALAAGTGYGWALAFARPSARREREDVKSPQPPPAWPPRAGAAG